MAAGAVSRGRVRWRNVAVDEPRARAGVARDRRPGEQEGGDGHEMFAGTPAIPDVGAVAAHDVGIDLHRVRRLAPGHAIYARAYHRDVELAGDWTSGASRATVHVPRCTSLLSALGVLASRAVVRSSPRGSVRTAHAREPARPSAVPRPRCAWRRSGPLDPGWAGVPSLMPARVPRAKAHRKAETPRGWARRPQERVPTVLLGGSRQGLPQNVPGPPNSRPNAHARVPA